MTADDLLRALLRDGWVTAHQEGSHIQLRHPAKLGRVTVAYHRGDILNPKTLSQALKQAGLSVDNLRRLL